MINSDPGRPQDESVVGEILQVLTAACDLPGH